MAKKRKRNAKTKEKRTLRRLLVANAIGATALLLALVITLLLLGLLPSVWAFFF